MKQFKIISTAANTSIIIYKDNSKHESDRFKIAFVNMDGVQHFIYTDGYPLTYAYKLAYAAAKTVNKRLSTVN